MKRAIPRGFCLTCRWAMGLPAEAAGPFQFHCTVLPPVYQPQEGASPLDLPNGAEPDMTRMRMGVRWFPKRETDFCGLYEPEPKTKPVLVPTPEPPPASDR